MSNKPDAQSDDIRATWGRDGFIVVPAAVDADTVHSAAAELWAYLEMDPADPATWYDADIRRRSGIDERGMVPLYHAPAVWRVRESERIFQAFSELLDETDLVVSFDRSNMNPPATDDWTYDGFIHWDIDITRDPVPFELQGLVALSDCPAGTGGFRCAPGFHHRLAAWLRDEGRGFSGRFPDTTGMDIVPVPLRAGDLLVWRGELPHGNSANLGRAPRLAQYLTFKSAASLSATEIETRRRSYLDGRPPISATMGKPFPEPVKPNLARVPLSRNGFKILGFAP
jgi:ectoine hydroxylase-related dioxygenase (phytanoyl-CoA dioxygenase family)